MTGSRTAAAGSPALTTEELARYARHLVLPQVGIDGQRQLKAARVLLIGMGGLGSPAGLYLAAAGVGTLGLVDFDVVEHSNLQRQVVHGTADVGRSKVASAAARLADVNPNVSIEPHETRLASGNALGILAEYDVIVDGSDNFPTRYLVNDACVLLGKPDVYGSIYRFEGQVSVFWGERGPCYRCLYRDPPTPELVPSCAEGGVLGVLPGIIGSLQAMEAIKLLLGAGDTLVGRLVLLDALKMGFRELTLDKDPGCPACGEHPTIDHLIDYEAFCGVAPPAREGADAMEVTARELKDELERGKRVVLVDVREQYEWEICHIDGSTLIPLGELQDRTAELDPDADIVTICHQGSRARQAAFFLRAEGKKGVRTLTGGVDAWAMDVDRGMAKY
ncbi:MAG: molybdopterin-synthase adenylyltransferase MoeB [Gemmatimonadales bacterium]|nr:molybdopterin-synthase adenylyltransferase MoeB [Gemmatimonadales bacterium]